MDFVSPAPTGANATLAAQMPLRKIPDVKQVTPGDQSGKSTPDKGGEHDNGAQSDAARDITALRRELQQREILAGPTPTFEISQLEMDADLRAVMARMEAARAHDREAEAVRVAGDAPEAEAEAEAEAEVEDEVEAEVEPAPPTDREAAA